MSKRKEPELGAAADAAADTAGAPPPRLGDHSAYMPEPMLPLADVRIKVKGGVALPVHASALVLNCGALARSSELFVGASAERPAALSSPFDQYAEADVARFLRCIYTAADSAAHGGDAALPAVVHLAHALDAAPVLAAAQRHYFVDLTREGVTTMPEVCEAFELAALCGWDDVRAALEFNLVGGLQVPLGNLATQAQRALSDAAAFKFAGALVDDCPPELVKRVVGALAATCRRMHSLAPEAAYDSALDPAAVAAASTLADGAAVELDGRFVAATFVPDFSDARPAIHSAFESHGLGWELELEPNGAPGEAGGRPRIALKLTRGWPKKVRYEVGFLDHRGGPPYDLGVEEDVFVESGDSWSFVFNELAPVVFRLPERGLVEHGLAAPFVRILEVGDATPEEAAAAEAVVAAEGL